MLLPRDPRRWRGLLRSGPSGRLPFWQFLCPPAPGLPPWAGLPASGGFTVPGRWPFPFAVVAPRSALRTPHFALRTRNSCSRLYLRPRVSPRFRFPGLHAVVPACRNEGGFPVPRPTLLCPVFHSAFRTPHSLARPRPVPWQAALVTPVPALLYENRCPQVSGSPFPVPGSPLLGVIHNGVCTSVHVKNRQIRVKIDQKGDVFRQKGIKKARISSCPS